MCVLLYMYYMHIYIYIYTYVCIYVMHNPHIYIYACMYICYSSYLFHPAEFASAFCEGGCRAHRDLPYYYMRLMYSVWLHG